MQRTVSKRSAQRPLGGGAFFDYVCEAVREHARRRRARRERVARRERRRAEGRLTSAEQRWEGEGGSTWQGAPGALGRGAAILLR